MAEKQLLCNSCHKRITNAVGSTRFMCPKCAKFEVVRCYHCRETASKYKCDSCGFEGPN